VRRQGGPEIASLFLLHAVFVYFLLDWQKADSCGKKIEN
jgi:hypothetical protein